jgi:hypothetical protein
VIFKNRNRDTGSEVLVRPTLESNFIPHVIAVVLGCPD